MIDTAVQRFSVITDSGHDTEKAMLDEELQDLVQERLVQAVVALGVCAVMGIAIVAAAPSLRALPRAAAHAVVQLPAVIRAATRTARETATTTVAAVEDGWRASGEK
jgi:hypothetical protein